LGFAGKATPQRAIRAICGSVAVEKAPHLHADPCQARVPAVEVAQVHVVSQLPLQNLDVHFSIGETLRVIIPNSCDRQLFGGTSVTSKGHFPSAETVNCLVFTIHQGLCAMHENGGESLQ